MFSTLVMSDKMASFVLTNYLTCERDQNGRHRIFWVDPIQSNTHKVSVTIDEAGF